MSEQKELTKAKLQIMQVLWRKGDAFMNEILQDLEEPRPAYNTVSTVLRVLQNEGFVAYRSFGKNYQYYSPVSKENYMNRFMSRVVDSSFSGSAKAMVSSFIKKEEMSVQKIDELIEMLKGNKREQGMIDIDCSKWVILRPIGASFVLWLCYYLLFDRKAPSNQCRNHLLLSILLAGAVSVVRIPVHLVKVVWPIKMERVVIKQEI